LSKKESLFPFIVAFLLAFFLYPLFIAFSLETNI